MEPEQATVMDYVYKHPYRSIADIADALNMSVDQVEFIVNNLHNDWKVSIVYDHFDSMYGYTKYDSPLVEPEIDSK